MAQSFLGDEKMLKINLVLEGQSYQQRSKYGSGESFQIKCKDYRRTICNSQNFNIPFAHTTNMCSSSAQKFECKAKIKLAGNLSGFAVKIEPKF